jgi:GTP-binding protein EngB required for normal cell division
LPTTATLHWVAWAPDPFARIVVRGAADRVVFFAELKNALATVQKTPGVHVERVYIYAPIERLRHVEILDTPGFNAPDPEHAKAARSAFDEAHVVLWLLDAVGAMKASEMKVIEELKELGVPTLVFLNKSDRLKPNDLETVLAHVRASLKEAETAELVPPLALSARLALTARISNDPKEKEDALAASHFTEVEAVLEHAVVERADVLREDGMRRKAARLAKRLHDEAEKQHAKESERRKAALEQRSLLAQASSKLLRDADAMAREIDSAMEPHRRALAHDLTPLSELSEQAQKEASVLYYVADRFTSRAPRPSPTRSRGARAFPAKARSTMRLVRRSQERAHSWSGSGRMLRPSHSPASYAPRPW